MLGTNLSNVSSSTRIGVFPRSCQLNWSLQLKMLLRLQWSRTIKKHHWILMFKVIKTNDWQTQHMRREEPRAEGRGNNSNNAEAEQKMTKNGLTESGPGLAGICPQLELRMNTTVVQWGEGGGLARSRHVIITFRSSLHSTGGQSNLLSFLGEISAF